MGHDVGWGPPGAENTLSSSPVGGWSDPAWLICPSVITPIRTRRGHSAAEMSHMFMPLAPTQWPRSRVYTMPPPSPLTHSQPAPLTLLSLPLHRSTVVPRNVTSALRNRATWLMQPPPLHSSTLPILPSPAAEPPAGALPRLTPAPSAMGMMHFPHSDFYYSLIFLDLLEPAPFLFAVTRNHPG